jgi:hypothetical protein
MTVIDRFGWEATAMTAPPAPSTPVAPADVPALVADIRWGLDQASAGVDTIAGSVNSFLGGLPEFVVGDLRNQVQQLRQQADEVIADISERIAYVGDPAALRTVGRVWADDIGGAVSGLAGLPTLNGLRADDYWTGIAGDAYRNALPPQAAALAAIKTTGDQIDAALGELANGIDQFWVAISAATLTFCAGIETAAVSAASIVGAGAAVAFGVAAVVSFVTAATTATIALQNVISTASSQSAAIERRLSDNTVFPGGAWPRSTTPISDDASIRDGDDTDWHLR